MVYIPNSFSCFGHYSSLVHVTRVVHANERNNANIVSGRLKKHSKTSFEKNCFSSWASTLNMGLINKVDMVCLSPVGYGV